MVSSNESVASLGEQLLVPDSEQLLKGMSDAYARGDGYSVDFVVDADAATFATSCTIDDKGVIKVGLSPELLKRAEAEDRLDFLGYATLHELGHVRRFQARPPRKHIDQKDAYFTNIVDDIAINYDNAKRTRFVHDMTERVYDDYLFPVEERSHLAQQPRHQQFMESLLTLAMTTDAHAKSDVAQLLDEASTTGIDEAVIGALFDVLEHEQNGTAFNLLGQLRAYGSDLNYTDQVSRVIREHYDKLYEADKADQPQQSEGGKSGDGSGEGQSFDYSQSGSCGHDSGHIKQPKTDDTAQPQESKSGENSGSSNAKGDQEKEGSTNSESGNNDEEPIDIQAIAEQIAENVKKALPDARQAMQDVPRDFTPEQLEKLRAELDLDEADFAGYIQARREFASEIRALQDILLQLRHDLQNEFLAPGREVAARGHRIRVDELVRAIANTSLGDQPDIWKHPAIVARIEHEFDGLDMYLLCDVSASMQGSKAEAAAGSAVVLQEGLLGASSQMAGEHTPIVRLQVQAFGAGHEMLCELTDEPSLGDLGRTYSALRNPTSGDTQVADALSSIKPEPGRLSVVVVVSDGAFHDSTPARQAGQKLADQNAAIIQLVYGGAEVEELADDAKRVNLSSARDLPQQLLSMLPELINVIRSSTHA